MEQDKELKDLPFVVVKRLETVELKSKSGEIFYKSQLIYETDKGTSVIITYFRDKDLYEDMIQIPLYKDFKLFYEVGFLDNQFKIIPVACSL